MSRLVGLVKGLASAQEPQKAAQMAQERVARRERVMAGVAERRSAECGADGAGAQRTSVTAARAMPSGQMRGAAPRA